MHKRQVIKNAMMAITQVILSGVVLFFLYRYLLRSIGVEKIAVWSVVLATTSASRIGELGLLGGVVRFVAKYVSRDETKNVSEVIQTATVSLGVLLAGMLIVVYPVIKWVLHLVMPEDALPDAFSLLPYALLALWINATAGVFLSGLDGIQRIDLRSLIMVATNLLFFVLVLFLVPHFGLIGVAYAHVLQACAVLLASWIVLRRNVPMLPLFPIGWNRALFREMLRYGASFQVTAIVVMLFDPVTKSLMSKFGSLQMVGYYEMANRMVTQFRALLVSANRVLVPVFSGLQERAPAQIRTLYRDSYDLLMYLSLPLFAGIIAASPIISEIWIGHYEAIFVMFSTLLCLAWLVNTLSSPAYFSNLGTGHLAWNTVAHVIIGVLNAGLGYLLGIIYGGIGVVVGWVVALVIGSLILIVSFQASNGIALRDLVPSMNRWLALSSIIAASVGLLIYFEFRADMGKMYIEPLSLLLFLTIILPASWRHPIRVKLMRWMGATMAKSEKL